MHARTQQNLHPLICGVNLAPANAMNPYRRPQGGQLYGGSCGSVESEWNVSGWMVVTSYLSNGNDLWISRPGGRLIDTSYGTANGYADGYGGVMGCTYYG